MSNGEQGQQIDFTVTKNNLYREEAITDLKVASIRRLVPIKTDGSPDASRPELIQGFTRNTFIAMVNSVRREALERGMMQEAEWQQGVDDLERTTAPDGTFCYSFFKGVATA